MEQITWIDNKKLMVELWPSWKPSQAEANLLNRRWGQLHQDKLRECIEQHRLERDKVPDISTIHKTYCKITGVTENGYDGRRDAVKTRNEAVTGPTQQEYAEWDAWAAGIMATATEDEIETAKERYGVKTDRLLAVAIDHMRRKLA